MAKQKPEPEDKPDEKPAAPPANDLMTTKDLMNYLMMSRTKIWELVHKKGLPAFRIGGDYRYRRSEVDIWLESQKFIPGTEKDE